MKPSPPCTQKNNVNFYVNKNKVSKQDTKHKTFSMKNSQLFNEKETEQEKQ